MSNFYHYASNTDLNQVVIKAAGTYVTIDAQACDVLNTDTTFTATEGWTVHAGGTTSPAPQWLELADNATTTLDVRETEVQKFGKTKRFRIPKTVVAEGQFNSATLTLAQVHEFADSDAYNFDDIGENTESWIKKIIRLHPAPPAPIQAAGFTPQEGTSYFGIPVDANEPFVINELLSLSPSGRWRKRVVGEWVSSEEPDPDSAPVLLDSDSAEALAAWIDEPEGEALEFSNIYPEEFGLFFSAEAELDLEFMDRVFDIYDTQERSVNAQKQVRGQGGKFAPNPGGGEATQAAPKARLPVSLPLIPNISERIAEYLAEVQRLRGDATPAPEADAAPAPEAGVEGDAPLPPVDKMSIRGRAERKQLELSWQKSAWDYVEEIGEIVYDFATFAAAVSADSAGVATTDVRPLYVAIVDAIDTDAVLDLVALVPPKAGSEGADVSSWKRSAGKWISAPEILLQLRGSTPPAVVELSDESVLKSLVDQIDKSTQEEAVDEPAPAPGETEVDPATGEATTPEPVAASGEMPVIIKTSKDMLDKIELIKLEMSQKTSLKKDSRDKAASKGEALDDGSFPIKNKADLKRAIQAYGRAKNKQAAKRHIIKRARALKATDLIPENWSSSYAARGFAFSDGSLLILSTSDLREAIEEATGYEQQLHVIKRARALNRYDLIPKHWTARQDMHVDMPLWGPYGELLPIKAAGGWDQNRGNAETLRRYWTTGPGGAKIGWGAGGDWYRCVSHLSKYLGTRAKGYCALRHKEMLGFWPGKQNPH